MAVLCAVGVSPGERVEGFHLSGSNPVGRPRSLLSRGLLQREHGAVELTDEFVALDGEGFDVEGDDAAFAVALDAVERFSVQPPSLASCISRVTRKALSQSSGW